MATRYGRWGRSKKQRDAMDWVARERAGGVGDDGDSGVVETIDNEPVERRRR